MASTKSDISSFSGFVSSLTPDQLTALCKEISTIRAPTEGITTQKKVDNDSNKIMRQNTRPIPIGSRLKTSSTRRQASLISGPLKQKLRPLNSFIAFRSYYSPIFHGLTQKAKSGLMRLLWESDCCKGKWSLVAKAFTEVRVGGINLESFLAIATPLIGIIPPGQYLDTMGFAVVDNLDRSKELIKIYDATLDSTVLTTNLSVKDIVEHCYGCGLVKRPEVVNDGAGNAMTMAFAAKPKEIGNIRSRKQMQMEEELNLNELVFGHAAYRIDQATEDQETFTADMSQSMNLSHGTVIADQSQAFDAMSSFPFDIHFHPSVADPILGYDPQAIQDDFEPFDVSEFLNM